MSAPIKAGPTTKLEQSRAWMTAGNRSDLAKAADALLQRSDDDFQLAVEALCAANERHHEAIAKRFGKLRAVRK